MPSTYWVEALHMACHLFNILPSSTIDNDTPFSKLFQKPVSYDHLRVFGCLCYPNLLPTSAHKLAPRSAKCVFLGYPSNHRGYRCLDLSTNKNILSRHVVFDESSFPFNKAPLSQTSSPPPSSSFPFSILHNLHHDPVTETPAPNPPPPASALFTPSPEAAPAPPPAPAPPRYQTRSRSGISKKKIIFSLHTDIISPLPRSHVQASKDPHWNGAMGTEYDAQIKSGTWKLVPRPLNANIVNYMWLFRHKFDAGGRLSRYKARLIANGKSQEVGIDCYETFSPVVKPATIRTVLHVATSRDWPIHQLDVKNAFLNGTLDEVVYMHQPPGFVDPDKPDHVCLLQKSLYGLKQAPRAWYQRFAQFATRIGFKQSKCDASLFIKQQGKDIAYLLLYVDDIALTASNQTLLRSIINSLHSEFEMTDLGKLHYFLGIAINRDSHGLHLNQRNYAADILHRAGMSNCNISSTPVDTSSKLSADAGKPVADPTLYRSLVGALQYLTFTRPDITYAVQQICLYMHDPREPHYNALKRILRYVKGTLDHGIQITRSSLNKITAYTDADWAGCPTTRRSTSGFCVFLGDNIVSWSSKRQATVSRSSAEAEYRGFANVVAETTWLRNLLLELRCPVSSATIVYCDNVSAVYLSTNPIQHQRTKHVEIDIHFVRERVSVGQVRVLHVPSSHQYADIFTKGLPSALFTSFRSSLSVRPPLAPTAGVC
ncbi:unnamed protein product [Microthlaspi erraticum]|uniref:Uncharacterized protein n=1 Tax=Microthlaspi erraticum TaxID=1685480 RepID=A0A6D2ING2_9BRAS|nr:unnamed protein product [Microthlaspi erraticum]